MSWNNRNGNSSNGARSKTFRNEGSSSKKKRNFSENSDDSWNRPKPPSTYASSGIWDDVPDDPVPQNNAWNENLVSKWSENNRSNTSETRKKNGNWNSIDHFPALESRPEPPTVNVWEVRKQKANQKKAMEPSNETEEERMLRQAIELSKIESERDKVRRRELEEEYQIQRHLLETNPNLYAEFHTDEEIASIFPAGEEVNYEAEYQNSFSEEEYNHQNPLPKRSAFPSKSDQSESFDSHNTTLSLGKSTNSKEKITKVVDMFGGWGTTQGSSQSTKKSNSSARTQPKVTANKNDLVFESKEYKKSQERDDDHAWKTNDPVSSPSSANSKTRSSKNRGDAACKMNDNDGTCKTNFSNQEETDKDRAWKTDECEPMRKSDYSEVDCLSEDEDSAWKTDDPEPYDRSKANCLDKRAETDDDWAWKTEDPKHSSSVSRSVSSKMDCKNEDYAWETDDPEPYSSSKANCSNNRAETDNDSAWKTEDSKPSISTCSKKHTLTKSKDEDHAWKTNEQKIKPETNSFSKKSETDRDGAWKTEDLDSKTQSFRKSKDFNEEYAWKANDTKPNKTKTNYYGRSLETDQDRAWKTEDSIPKQNNSIKNSTLITQHSSWESEGSNSLQGSVSHRRNLTTNKIEKHENDSCKSNNSNPNGELESWYTSKDNAWRSDDVCYESSHTETKEVEESTSHSSLISQENIASGRNHETTASNAASGNIADSIVSDYRNLASSSKTDDQDLNFSNSIQPAPDKSVFDLLKKDYGKHFVMDFEKGKPSEENNTGGLSFLVKDTLEKTPGLPSESLSNGDVFNTFHTSNKEAPFSDIVSSNSIQPDEDISLPLFASTFNEADQNNYSKIVSDDFRQSFGAHFQQFQTICTITPDAMMNPYMMAGMSSMGMNPYMPQMGMNPYMPQMGVNPYMPQMGVNPMKPQMGMNPLMPQMGMNPMMPQMGMNPLMQPNPMMPQIGMTPMMQYMSIYKQMIGNTMVPQSNMPGLSSTEGNLDLNEFIPPPTETHGFNQTNELGNSPQIEPIGASIGPPSSFGKDKWLDQFLSKPVFNEEPIAAPTMPQINNLSLETNGVDSSVIPPPRGIDEVVMGASSATGNGDNAPKSMRNPSRYISEKLTEIRQPASMPSWGRGKQ